MQNFLKEGKLPAGIHKIYHAHPNPKVSIRSGSATGPWARHNFAALITRPPAFMRVGRHHALKP